MNPPSSALGYMGQWVSCVDCKRPIPAYQVGKRDGRCVRCHLKQQQAS